MSGKEQSTVIDDYHARLRPPVMKLSGVHAISMITGDLELAFKEFERHAAERAGVIQEIRRRN